MYIYLYMIYMYIYTDIQYLDENTQATKNAVYQLAWPFDLLKLRPIVQKYRCAKDVPPSVDTLVMEEIYLTGWCGE